MADEQPQKDMVEVPVVLPPMVIDRLGEVAEVGGVEKRGQGIERVKGRGTRRARLVTERARSGVALRGVGSGARVRGAVSGSN